MTTPSTSIRDTVAQIMPEIVALRHELHQHPEIRFEEVWTSDRIARFLTEAGIEHTRGHAKGTGIVGTIEGKGSRTVGLRSDMDALEIEELTRLPYASTIPERMHACGHDGHMACLCGTAQVLKAHQDELRGTVKLIFQPAEEEAAGGRYIVEEGILDDVDGVFGLHGWPTNRVGDVGLKSGIAMAGADFFQIDVVGKGCHAADPASGVDPILVASHIVTAIQSIVSREINPWDPAVVTVARIEAGHASNVIPESARMVGTFRTLRDTIRIKVRDAIERIAVNTALAHNAQAHVSFDGAIYPPLYNDEEMSAFAKDIVRDTFGPDHLHEPEVATMGAEDFAYYLQKVPGAFLFLGTNPSETEAYPALHNPHYDFTDAALPVGIELMSTIALHFLAK